MYPVPTVVADWLRKPYREFAVKALVNDVEYGDDVIVDFSIENSLSLSDELELGTVIPNKLTIRFRMHSQFPPNAKIVPYIALKTDNLTWDEADMSWEEADFAWEGGTTDWIPLGEFYVDNRTKDRDIWTYVCYDRLVFADVEYVSGLNYPTTMQAVWDEICELIGFTYDDSVEIDPSYTITAGPAGFTCRQVMGFIASANAACVYMGKDGVLRFRKISAAAQPVFEMNESDYIRAKQVNPLKTYSRVVIIYDKDDGLYYEAGTGSEAETLYIENPFGTQAMANKILAEINGFSYTPISMPARGYPQLDQGDIISFEAVESMSWEDADMSWEDADFPWDGAKQYQTIILHQALDFRGGLSMQIEAPSISEQKSEFPVEGTLTEAVNRLNRNAVRYGKPYYGVTHSREEGIVVQREDGTAKAVFNADELAFYQGGQRRLYFDAVNNRYVFDGHLQAASGTFTGELQGGSITIGSGNNVFRAGSQGIWSGHTNFNSAPFRVNMQGEMTAMSGTFGGTLQAAGGTFTGTLQGVDGTFKGTVEAGQFVGGTITGALIQTNASGYPYIALTSTTNFLTAAASPIQMITIEASRGGIPYLSFKEGNTETQLWQSGSFFTLGSDGHITIFPNLELRLTPILDLELFPYTGDVLVPNWNRFVNNQTGRSLQQELNALSARIAALGG